MNFQLRFSVYDRFMGHSWGTSVFINFLSTLYTLARILVFREECLFFKFYFPFSACRHLDSQSPSASSSAVHIYYPLKFFSHVYSKRRQALPMLLIGSHLRKSQLYYFHGCHCTHWALSLCLTPCHSLSASRCSNSAFFLQFLSE